MKVNFEKNRPTSVLIAVIFLSITQIISIIEFLINTQFLSLELLKNLNYYIILVFFAIFFLIYKTYKRANYARYILLILTIASSLILFIPLIYGVNIFVFAGSSGIINFILEILAVVLLLRKDSNIWFKG